MSVRKLHAVVTRQARRPGAFIPAGRHSAERIVWAVQAASRYVPGATCLPQALTAEFMLMRHGHPARLRIGMTMSEDRALEGHAWVESDGAILLGGENVTRYTPMAEPWAGDRR